MTKRKRNLSEIQARVALETIREALTLAELSKKSTGCIYYGPAMDNRMIERLGRSLKYECVYVRF